MVVAITISLDARICDGYDETFITTVDCLYAWDVFEIDPIVYLVGTDGFFCAKRLSLNYELVLRHLEYVRWEGGAIF